MQIFDYITITLLSSISLAVLYLYLIAFYGLILFRRKVKVNYCVDKKILILIPAHDEGKIIHNVLESLAANEYPKDNYDIIVIADNCSDRTAEVARSHGAEALERFDESNRGKGHALKYALDKTDLSQYDLVIVIDADNFVEADLLKTAAGYIDSGCQVVQCFSGFLAVDKTAYAYLQYLSNIVENHLYHHPRSNLSLYGCLKGSGMIFKSDLFKKVPWESESIVEDFDYSIKIIEHGIPVYNTMATKVYENATRYFSQAFNQRVRGSSGVFQLIKEYFFRLIKAGIEKEQFRLVEYAFSLLLLSRPLLIYIAALAMLVGLLGSTPMGTLIWGAGLSILLVFYLFFGLFLSPAKGPLFKAILLSPFFGVWLLLIQILSVFGYKKNQWSRTERILDE